MNQKLDPNIAVGGDLAGVEKLLGVKPNFLTGTQRLGLQLAAAQALADSRGKRIEELQLALAGSKALESDLKEAHAKTEQICDVLDKVFIYFLGAEYCEDGGEKYRILHEEIGVEL